MPQFRSLFGRGLPATRLVNTSKILSTCCEETLEKIRGNMGDALIRVAVDKQRILWVTITNLVAGKLHIEVPSNAYLIFSIPLLQDL
jgi:hypothetical protein